MSKVITDRRLYLTSDGVLVEHGDPSAAFLWACEGREVAADVAAAVGYKPATESQDAEADTSDVEVCAGTTAAGASCAKKAGPDGFCHFHSK